MCFNETFNESYLLPGLYDTHDIFRVMGLAVTDDIFQKCSFPTEAYHIGSSPLKTVIVVIFDYHKFTSVGCLSFDLIVHIH